MRSVVVVVGDERIEQGLQLDQRAGLDGLGGEPVLEGLLDSIVWNATDQERIQRLLTAWTKRFADPHLPRTLTQQLQNAGLQVRHRDVLVLFNPEYDPDTFSVANGEIMVDFAVAHHAMMRAEAQSWIQDLQGSGGKAVTTSV